MTKTKGTKEWTKKDGHSGSNVNFQFGCKNGCKYCYAAQFAIRGYKNRTVKHKNLKQWSALITIRQDIIRKNFGKRKGIVMFPSTHDLYFENIGETLIVLGKLLEAKNEVLVVTKPDLNTIRMICHEFEFYRDQILFRFTIGSMSSEILAMWEPHAPDYEERLAALKYAYDKKFKTSISIEPYLDLRTNLLIEAIEPYVTDTIWIGLMNYQNMPYEGKQLYKKCNYVNLYSEQTVRKYLPEWKEAAQGKLRLKDSIKNLLHIDDSHNTLTNYIEGSDNK